MIETEIMIDKKRPNERQKDRKETERRTLVVWQTHERQRQTGRQPDINRLQTKRQIDNRQANKLKPVCYKYNTT